MSKPTPPAYKTRNCRRGRRCSDAESVIDAVGTMGDRMRDMAGIALHSDTHRLMLKQDMIDYGPDSRGQAIASYRGMALVVDDLMPKAAGVCVTALFSPAAVGWGRRRLAGAARSPCRGGDDARPTGAFTVTPDPARQEQVWEALQRHYSKAPHEIRRMLTEGAVRASDKRAQFEADSRAALFAQCVALTVNAVHDPYLRRPRALAHGDVLATVLGLDITRAGWAVTAVNYLGRVTKARILEAVREAKRILFSAGTSVARSRTLCRCTGKGPIPVWIIRAGPVP